MEITNEMMKQIDGICAKRITDRNAHYMDDIKQEVYLAILQCKEVKNIERYVNKIITAHSTYKKGNMAYYFTPNYNNISINQLIYLEDEDSEV